MGSKRERQLAIKELTISRQAMVKVRGRQWSGRQTMEQVEEATTKY